MSTLGWIIVIGVMVIVFQLCRVGTRLLLDLIYPPQQLKITYIDKNGTSHSTIVDVDDDFAPLLEQAKQVSRRKKVRSR